MKIIEIQIKDHETDSYPQKRIFQIIDGTIDTYGYINSNDTSKEFDEAFTDFLYSNLDLFQDEELQNEEE